MTTILEGAFQQNPFENPTFTPARKIVFGLDEASRLEALDAAIFASHIDLTRACCEALSAALGSTGSSLSQQTGATASTNEKLAAVRYAIGSNAPLVKKRVQGDKSLLKKIFTTHVEYFTTELNHTNAAERLDEMSKNLKANPTLVTKEITEEINGAIKAYWDDRKVQTTEKTAVNTGRLNSSTAEQALNQQLWLNECAVVQAYPAPEQLKQRQAATNHALLLRVSNGSHASTFADFIQPQLTADVVADTLPAATKRLVLANPGPVRLCFALSASPTEFPSTGVVEIVPGAQQKMKLQGLGDPTVLPYLLVHNPTSELGQYKVTLG
ncbi:hypothetical protein Q5H93_12990 [Hymenobacter sp. ASUV-10]|uniref:Uncharacterized protein n=1 Tax=Hymenobacter aranciens TaxID=3063996 RepID=A0ABT9BGK8_9BACT|nr:hypothetical protein [Hymenobacter sp. ASUV-10]MDO7875653.1 hypothetical protein [Hymenobacter sp. ASUV-10]